MFWGLRMSRGPILLTGLRELHDRYRAATNGKPTFDAVLAAADKLCTAQVPFAALCVVNRENASYPRVDYRI